jgi:hypothetical protein
MVTKFSHCSRNDLNILQRLATGWNVKIKFSSPLLWWISVIPTELELGMQVRVTLMILGCETLATKTKGGEDRMHLMR